jgi:hypothetical protein
MPTNITDVDSFDTATAPVGSDVRNAASILSPLQKLANRTRYLLNRIPNADPSINGLRLTLASGTPVTTANVATATTVYFTPFTSGSVALFDGSVWTMRTTGEISIALGTLVANKNYDIFASWNGSAVVLEFSAAWTTDTARADAIAFQNGVAVKNGFSTKRLVGTIRTISTTQTTDTFSQRFVWNGPEPFRQVPRPLVVTDPSNWTFASAAVWRQARATSTNRVEYVSGAASTYVKASSRAMVSHSAPASNTAVYLGIGIDSTTVNSAQTYGSRPGDTTSVGHMEQAEYDGYPGLGYHAINWLEHMRGAGTASFGSSLGDVAGVRALISG